MFNKKVLLIGATATVLSFAAMSGYADSRTAKISDFNALSVNNGLEVDVVCGSAQGLALEGPALDNVKIKQEGKKLILSYDKRMFSRLNGDDVEVKLTVTQPLQEVLLMNGVELKMDKCAVCKDLALKMDKGAKAHVSGNVDKLNLMMSEGSRFNNGDQKFLAKKITLAMSRGAQANLCGAKEITGSASEGSELKVAKNAAVKVALTSGADVERDDCS